MTRTELKAKVNEVSDMLQYFLNKGDHENVRKCAELIADMVYTQMTNTEEA